MTVTRLRRSDSGLLLHVRYTDGVVEALTGQAATFSRSGDGYALASNGLYLRAAHSRPRLAADVNDVVGLLLEASQENLVLESANFDDSSSPWLGNGNFTISAATSVIPGQTAHQHTADGATGRHRDQTLGAFTGSPETLVVLAEEVDAPSTRFSIRDVTASGWVAIVDYSWSTGLTSLALSNAGSSVTHGRVDLGDGRILMWVTGTPDNAGNTREVWIYPTGNNTTTTSTILHYAGLVESAFLTSPIVTAASSNDRKAEELAYTYNVPSTKPWSAWVRFIAPPAGSPALLRLGGSAPDVVLEVTSGGEIQATHDNNTSTVSSVTSGLSMSHGDVVDARVRFGSDGRVTVGASVNEGAETTGSQSGALTPASWGSAELYPGGLSAEMARVIIREIKIPPDPDATMAELRRA